MVITHNERVGKALDLLMEGLAPFVWRLAADKSEAGALPVERLNRFEKNPLLKDKRILEWDASALLNFMESTWDDVFRTSLGRTERSLVVELLHWRNRWAHQEKFSSEDAERALDSVERLLTALSAPQADKVRAMKLELRRLSLEEEMSKVAGPGATVVSPPPLSTHKHAQSCLVCRTGPTGSRFRKVSQPAGSPLSADGSGVARDLPRGRSRAWHLAAEVSPLASRLVEQFHKP